MRKNILKIWDLPSNGATAALIIMAIVFLVGGFAGCTLAGQSDSAGDAALSRYLDGFLNVAVSDDLIKPKFIFLLWKTIRWPLFIFFLGLTPIGLIGIPVLFLVRAFLLSFSIASFYHVSGTEGLVFAFFIFGITGIIYIPILFVLGIHSFLRTGITIGRITGESKRISTTKHSDTVLYCVCFFVLILCCFIEFSSGPTVLKGAVELFTN